jgi:hypothetical protein
VYEKSLRTRITNKLKLKTISSVIIKFKHNLRIKTNINEMIAILVFNPDS